MATSSAPEREPEGTRQLSAMRRRMTSLKRLCTFPPLDQRAHRGASTAEAGTETVPRTSIRHGEIRPTRLVRLIAPTRVSERLAAGDLLGTIAAALCLDIICPTRHWALGKAL